VASCRLSPCPRVVVSSCRRVSMSSNRCVVVSSCPCRSVLASCVNVLFQTDRWESVVPVKTSDLLLYLTTFSDCHSARRSLRVWQRFILTIVCLYECSKTQPHILNNCLVDKLYPQMFFKKKKKNKRFSFDSQLSNR
jgi:hypothetical protein